MFGVNSQNTSWEALSDTNRTSVITKICDKLIRYWIYIKDSTNPIIQDILEASKQLHKKGKTHGSLKLDILKTNSL